MNTIVVEHAPIAELPEAWRAKQAQRPGTAVTVRMESKDQRDTKARADDLLFGMWRHQEERPMRPAASSASIDSMTCRAARPAQPTHPSPV